MSCARRSTPSSASARCCAEDAESAQSRTSRPLDRVLGAARHLLALINDILDLSKIEAGRMELHLDTFSLVPVIEDVAKTIEPHGDEERQSASRIDCPADLGTIHADQTRLPAVPAQS